MRKFRITIILQSGTSSYFQDYIVENIVDFNSYSMGYHEFKDTNNNVHIYPILGTIVNEL